MLTGAAKLDAERMPGTVPFSCNPTGGKPAEVIVVPSSANEAGGGVERLPAAEALQLGRRVRGDGGNWHRWKSPEEEILPRKLYMVGFARWVCG